MPPLIFLLAGAVFAQGTSEFVLSGLLPQIAAGTGVSLGTAGLLTSLFAAGMVVGAPVLAMLGSKLPRKQALLAFLGLFSAVHVIGALTTDFPVLLATRALAAFANAGFLAIALASLPAFVPADAVGRATSVLLSGVTLACVVGVPAGTVLGQYAGWQAAFWAIAAITSAAAVALTPAKFDNPPVTSPVYREWRVLAQPRVAATVGKGVLVNGGTFAAFTYLGTMTSPAGWVPVVLAMFGAGSFAGVTIAGKAGPGILKAGTAVLTAGWVAAYFAAQSLPGLIAAALLTGAMAFGAGSALIAAIVTSAGNDAPRVAGAIATTAFNLGAVVGPAVAGAVVLDAAHARAAFWVSAAFTAAAMFPRVKK
ncbi:MFS transporter [Amycolatopsis rubida]|uniref:MFS transporter n=1 Tax=Amycolatopsis rubida TaxID=112413 RepID=A0ABX0BHN5_9PSEU|nr:MULTISPECIES: MFS transporter [Amycolatopsis]MYW89669.1 MFS transporter [Amycolatopsis rubida]NEC54645.1 MFS transporter [Amycolatopsis rubida]OAP23547.1 Inner membrane transport protein YdhP [Amycolatopsis sp. M39]